MHLPHGFQYDGLRMLLGVLEPQCLLDAVLRPPPTKVCSPSHEAPHRATEGKHPGNPALGLNPSLLC